MRSKNGNRIGNTPQTFLIRVEKTQLFLEEFNNKDYPIPPQIETSRQTEEEQRSGKKWNTVFGSGDDYKTVRSAKRIDENTDT